MTSRTANSTNASSSPEVHAFSAPVPGVSESNPWFMEPQKAGSHQSDGSDTILTDDASATLIATGAGTILTDGAAGTILAAGSDTIRTDDSAGTILVVGVGNQCG